MPAHLKSKLKITATSKRNRNDLGCTSPKAKCRRTNRTRGSKIRGDFIGRRCHAIASVNFIIILLDIAEMGIARKSATTRRSVSSSSPRFVYIRPRSLSPTTKASKKVVAPKRRPWERSHFDPDRDAARWREEVGEVEVACPLQLLSRTINK